MEKERGAKRVAGIWIVAALVLLFAMTTVAIDANAGSPIPNGVEVFVLSSGQTCFLWPDGSGDCYCDCEADEVLQPTLPKSSEPITERQEDTQDREVDNDKGPGNGGGEEGDSKSGMGD